MNNSAFTTVCTARTLAEADLLTASLRAAGLHPVELGTFGYFPLAGADIEYPIRVPTKETLAAKDILETSENSTDAND